MKKIFPVLLIGILSMFFAEVFSGASQVWFLSGWGLLLTLPLYLSHVLFFLWIALRLKKTSLPQLYFFGAIFSLYESWITKVLWSGYMDSVSLGFGSFLGIGIFEFPILTFFWHPIMSFILPILVFEILTNKSLVEHNKILTKSKKKTFMIVLFLAFIGSFAASGNGFNLLSVNFSVIGTVILIFIFSKFSKDTDLKVFEFKKKGFILTIIYLVLLYLVTFFALLPEKLPNTIIPYLSIIVFYVIFILLIKNSKIVNSDISELEENNYSKKDLFLFLIVYLISVNVFSLISNIGAIVLIIVYLLLIIIGVIVFLRAIYKIFR